MIFLMLFINNKYYDLDLYQYSNPKQSNLTSITKTKL